jgi:ribose-phosphate pyrophosphokinase
MHEFSVLNLFSKTNLASKLTEKFDQTLLDYDLRRFPDGETYFRLLSKKFNKKIIIIADLNQPDNKLMPLLTVAESLKTLGVKSVGLVSPYLPYMRQDIAFHSGEAITSRVFSKIISDYFDWMVTVDPHLHRYHDLSEIYSIPTQLVHANRAIASWVKNNIKNPILIGPDSESEQWLSKIAGYENLPFIIFEKQRHGDYDVEVSSPKLTRYLDHTPVLIDDIISTAKTMIVTIEYLTQLSMQPAICIGVHAVFSEQSDKFLVKNNIRKLVTCNTIFHETNQIDLSDDLIAGISKIDIV